MKINDDAGRLGLYQDARFLVGLPLTDTSSYTIHDFIRNANAWYRKANSWIWEASSIWEYDDANQTTLPIATTNLVAAQQDYELPSTAQRVIRVEACNSSGDWVQLKQIDQSEISDAMTEFQETDGMPYYYDVIGSSLMLYPAPSASDVTLAAGLKLYFARDISEFSVTQTDTEPGFADNFHRVLSLGAALDYLYAGYDPDDISRVNHIRAQIEELKEEMHNFYGTRDIGKKRNLNASTEGAFGL